MSDRQLLTQKEFALQQGWAQSYVTQLKQAGRLVIVDGKVDVAASLRRIADTADHNRDDVAQRHAANRQAKVNNPEPTADDDRVAAAFRINRARKMQHDADKAGLEAEQLAGRLVDRQDVEFVMDDLAALLSALLDNLPGQLAPVVFPIKTLEETHDAIEEAAQGIIDTLQAALRKKSREMREVAQ